MTQLTFLPVICDRTKAPPSSTDADCIAIDDSTAKRYLCKSGRDNLLLPATEWICAALARAVCIPIADSAVIQVKGDTELMYGSLWEGGEQKDSLAALPKVTNFEIFSDALAFDFSVHNVDRHISNYLYLELAGDIVAKIIDASKAFIYHSMPPPPLPLDPDCPTILSKAHWNKFHPYTKTRAVGVTQKILALPTDWMRQTLSGIPDEWLTITEAEELDRWWRDERLDRMNSVVNEL